MDKEIIAEIVSVDGYEYLRMDLVKEKINVITEHKNCPICRNDLDDHDRYKLAECCLIKLKNEMGDEYMDEFNLMKRQEILGLALGEAYRRMNEIQDKINDLEAEQNKYQEMVDNIREWQDELKSK